jgi:pimeloyl-ACP methyl ester carboxylesterase
MELNPVLFVHGIGASAKVWDEFELPKRNSYYFSELHLDLPHFAVPQKAQSAVLKALQI